LLWWIVLKTCLYSKTYSWKRKRIYCVLFFVNKTNALSFKACKLHGFIYNNRLSHPQSPPLTLFGWRLSRSSQKSEWGAGGCLRPWINIDQQRDSPFPPFLLIDSHVTRESNKKDGTNGTPVSCRTGCAWFTVHPLTSERINGISQHKKKSSTQEILPSW
jgi:hypothetical protein